jgi:murein DD-endopeptidase MepM/ murein hydrolase activator NlpD
MRGRHVLLPVAVLLTFLAVAVVPTAGTSGRAAAQTAEEDQRAAEKAARDILKARHQAEVAAQAFANAETQVAQTEEDLAKVQAEQDQVEQKTANLRSAVQQLAVLRYVQGAVDTGGLLLGGQVGDQLQADQYAEIAARASAQDVDAYETSLQDLERTRALLETAKKKSSQAAANFKAQRKNLEQKIAALQKAEAKRQKDAAVRRAVEAAAAEQRRQAEAAAAKAASEAAARAAALGGSSVIGSRVYVASGLLCPVAGPSTFVDTWGAPRSGGRRHQGVDMLSPRGTPSVAVVAGTIRISQNRLGGNALWLNGADGNSYYYAHFDRYGKGGAVNAGDVIGYVGDTGNARGTPHLHFEVHPGGGAAVDPYPTARAACG